MYFQYCFTIIPVIKNEEITWQFGKKVWLFMIDALLLLWLEKLRRHVFINNSNVISKEKKMDFNQTLKRIILWFPLSEHFKIIQLISYGIFSIMFRCVEISMEILFLWTETKLAHKKNMCSLRPEALNCLLLFFLNLFLSFSVNSTQMTKPKCWQLKAGKNFS